PIAQQHGKYPVYETRRPRPRVGETIDSDYDEGDAILAWGGHAITITSGSTGSVLYGLSSKDTLEMRSQWIFANSLREMASVTAQMIGPLRSLAWLAGLDELIKAIDHPAYVIQDDIEIDEWKKELYRPSSGPRTLPSAVPAAVKGTVETHSFQGNKKSYKLVRFDKSALRLEANIRKVVGAPLELKNLWFRGLNFGALESTLAFFI
ncbi:hypothetical protein N7471_007745, partial [Penicillium samsonianum]|uniref:uncharacterized protein n=1 Tax=Penicillium samsonianum TaxID=1882272 RepID=UPI0025493275